RLEYMNAGSCGLGFWVHAPAMTYFGCHLESFAKDLSSGSSVKRGQVIGFVGDSGNAVGGAPHLHFEMHPGSGAAINPKSTLDRWIAEAIANVPNLLGQYQTSLPRSLSAAGMMRRLDLGSLGGPTTADGPKLWMSSLKRDSTGVRLTSAGASGGDDPRAAALFARDAEAAAIDRVRAAQLSHDVLAPITPRVLIGILGGGGG
ncbi:MAG: M23 family metallopeptidase, partial [Acidimicrobiales bacterium]